MKQIQIVNLSEKEHFRNLFYEYLMELSQFDKDILFDINGTPIYKWFDAYFVDKDRYPFYFKIDNKIAGIAMIRILNDNKFEIAEFYVCKNFRGNGNAIWFADELLKLFDGNFEFSTKLANIRAVKFWNKFSARYNHKNFNDEQCSNWIIYKQK